MSVTRRQFLVSTVGAAGGFILPDFYFRALDFIDRFGKPLLDQPEQTTRELYICSERDGELNLGDPYSEPPAMTWRQCLERYYPHTLRDVEAEWGLSQSDLNKEAHWDWVVDPWCRTDSPNARAFHLLEKMDLGPNLMGPEAAGELIFTDGPCPGNDYLGVAVPDDISASLLQRRLNDLGTGIRVVTA